MSRDLRSVVGKFSRCKLLQTGGQEVILFRTYNRPILSNFTESARLDKRNNIGHFQSKSRSGNVTMIPWFVLGESMTKIGAH